MSNPSPNPNPNKSTDYVMVSVQTRNTSPACWCGHLVAVGSNIYIFSACMNGVPSSRVLFMDCRTHTWHEAPRMRMISYYTFVSVLDEKIYVFFDHFSSISVECYDTKTQTWEDIPSPNATINRGSNIKSLAVEGKLYMFGNDKNVVYKPKENRWDPVALEVDFPRNFNVHCTSCVMIDKVLYGYGSLSKRLQWYDFVGRTWRFLEGLEGALPDLPYHCTRLVNYGGNIVVLWEEDVCDIGSNEKMIWCAEISLERRNTEEIFGKVEWCDVVLTVPKISNVKQFIDVTL